MKIGARHFGGAGHLVRTFCKAERAWSNLKLITLREWPKTRKLEAIFVVVLLVGAAFMRLYLFGQAPPGLLPDEATHALDALEVMDGHHSLYSPDEGSTGMVWRYLLAGWFSLFGASIASLRGCAAFVGVLSAAAAYFAARQMFFALEEWDGDALAPRAGAFAVGLCVAFSEWHVSFSRIAFSAVLVLLTTDASFFFLWLALPKGRSGWLFYLSSFFLALSFYGYLPGKVIVLVPPIFFALDWALYRGDSFYEAYSGRLRRAAVMLAALCAPFVVYAVFNAGELYRRAMLPAAGQQPLSMGALPSMFVRAMLYLGLHPGAWRPSAWGLTLLGPAGIFVVVGLVFCVLGILRRRCEYLFLLLWWVVAMLPGLLAPEGAMFNHRRAIIAVTPTFTLALVGIIAPVRLLLMAARGRPGRVQSAGRIGAVVLVGLVGLWLASSQAWTTFTRYFPNARGREQELAFHVYDIELAGLMAEQSGPETVYLLYLDSTAGAINPLLDTITFVYEGTASYDFLSDEEASMPARLLELTRGKSLARLVRWNVTKHTGADPKNYAGYLLERAGNYVSTDEYPYYDIVTYEVDDPAGFSRPDLSPLGVSFGEYVELAGVARDADGSVVAGDHAWVELSWRKIAGSGADYQASVWLEDGAGHVVGRVDKPLLDDASHSGTSAWEAGTEGRDYYLLPVHPATIPGEGYVLKAVLYDPATGERMRPVADGVGGDLALPLGRVEVLLAANPMQPLDSDAGLRVEGVLAEGMYLRGVDLSLPQGAQPGAAGTLAVYWEPKEVQGCPYEISLTLGDIPLEVEPPALDCGGWPTKGLLRSFVDFRIPADVEGGSYPLALRLSGQDREAVGLATIDVQGRAHSFDAPPTDYPAGADFGGVVRLLGYDLETDDRQVTLTLVWKSLREVDANYKVFVHFLDEEGGILFQLDREPMDGEAPTSGWLEGEVVADAVSFEVTEEMIGARSVALGLYDPATGRRLPLAGGGDALVVNLP